ncbi:MAG TPA: hypothetical protein VH853_04840 [Polyangia bacterium]|jgi:hypothetical protein|nr:hypothetical protein [Polyangia bacterium]
MDTKPRLTKQGLRDLNHYGPKPKAAAGTPGPNGEGDGGGAGGEEVKASPPVAEKQSDAPISANA